ncbi:OmpL47-type beta-barrel domain-containing protein [Paenibacillus sp. GCM10027628]|uniref:OmpL47-type beta-barrel domain-containing protein n=1 Tax=Paenibacillus sp. GCM10027628 TaxID=3273413 RepID=UPI003632F261
MHKTTKVFSMLMLSLVILSTVFTAHPAASAADSSGNTGTSAIPFTEQQLKDNDYILYFVNAGDPTPRTVEGTDKMGLLASVTEQVYGLDPVTGKSWGLVTSTSGTNVSNAANKYGSLRYYNGPQVRNKALTYNFELPEGDYDVTFGFKNPWSGRTVNIILEGSNVSNGDYDIGSYGAEKEVVYKNIHVIDGQLNASIQGPSSGTLTNYNDPLVNYIIVRLHVTIPITDLQAQIAAAKVESGKSIYTKYSLDVLNKTILQAEALVARVTQNGVDIATVQDEVRAAINQLKQAMADLAVYVPTSAYTPGAPWLDTNGAPIQAHGGGILYDEHTHKYYWYGEDKTNGYLPARGVRVYASTDLYNWQDEGLALTAIESMGQFDTDPLISQLYAGRTDKADIFNDIGTQRIIERPKVIYNEKTHKYVMWMHTDGPSATSTANYAKAEAGYALSDSPTGPFVYQVSNRMDRVPPGATYDGQPNQPGMARDMNLFKDDDGTAYLIYSSEENMTIYISKLNDSYTDVVGWHKDGQAARDTTYKAEYGKDYIRVFPGAQREAPAMFKYAGKYYLITSGATGWAPNKALYTVADQVFGDWKPMRDLAVGTKASTTFDSQSTYVIPVDPAKGKFIFMGDRWNESNLKDSRYIWLPIEFGQNDEITLKWYDQWNLELLNRMGRVTVDTVLPTRVTVGQLPELPGIIHVTMGDGTSLNTPVNWSVNASDFAKPGTITVNGTLPEFGGKTIQAKINVIPEHAIYFVHAGGAATSDYVTWSSYMQKTLLNGNTIDQQYDPAKGQTWGYKGNSTNASGNETGNLFTSLRYLKGNSGNDLSYDFDLNKGHYTVYVGLHDPWYQWSKGSRIADIKINGETKTSGYVFKDTYDVLGYSNVEVTNGKLELTVHRSASAPATNSDPQISWIIIVDDVAPVTAAALTPDQPNGMNGWYTSDSTLTLTATDEGAGIATTEYRVNGGDWLPYTNPVLLTDEGKLTVEYRSTDLAGNTEESKTLAVQLDKTVPQLQLSVDKPVIGPPNHKMVPIHVTINADDSASGIAKVELVSITSNEPDNGSGDGNTVQDIQNAEFGTNDTDFSLRAERSGNGSGRVYTITYKATDHAGLETVGSVQVRVEK